MVSEKEKSVIEELFLVRDIIRYVVPYKPDSTGKQHPKKQSRLEEEIRNCEKNNKGSKESGNLGFLEQVLFELKANIDKKNSPIKNFSLDTGKKKDGKRSESHNGYSFTIKYRETESEERLQVETDDNTKRCSLEIIRNKPVSENRPYQINLAYRNSKGEENLSISYSLRDYPAEREKSMQDFTGKLDKFLHIMPKSLMGGVLGYTYLGENFMARRDDLTGDKALMVDVHESIHTPDEYETRVLTNWILTMQRPKYRQLRQI